MTVSGDATATASTVANEVYDDVIQCDMLYDDVDTKYDHMAFEPPMPPVRKRPVPTTVNTVPPTPVEEPNRPLPDTPSKMPSLISKLTGDKKSNAASSSSSSAKDGSKKKSSKKSVASLEDGGKPTSLFSKWFGRSKSVDHQNNATTSPVKGPPEVPPHKDDNGNPDSMEAVQSLEDLKDLQDFIDSGNLEQLDNMVTEFAEKYLPDEENSNVAMKEDANMNKT